MYSVSKMTFKYLQYLLKASNAKGHGMHSPFVFDFIVNVLNDERDFYCFTSIEAKRNEFLQNNNIIQVTDFGAGSKSMIQKNRKVSDIANSSLKPKKFAQLLFKIVDYYQLKNILEIGTSLGITTSYLASADTNNKVVTLEGANEVAKIAQQNFIDLQFKNIEVVVGNFDDTLDEALKQFSLVDFTFIDGNHRYEPTKNYFEKVLNKTHEYSIIILDDIHWSKEMEASWEFVKNHAQVTATIDLFFIGIVLLRKDFKSKQHFTIKF